MVEPEPSVRTSVTAGTPAMSDCTAMIDESGDHSYQSSFVKGPPTLVACAPSVSATQSSVPAAPADCR